MKKRSSFSNSLQSIQGRRAALELSIGTVVILVIGMSMLILGLVLVRQIFTGATYNVNTINDKVKDQISKLFQENGKSAVYLAEHKANPSQGSEWGVAFAIKNVETGTSQASQFTYEVKSSTLSSDCQGLTPQKADGWIKSRKTGSATLNPGESGYFIVRFSIPADAPLCIVPYDIEIRKNNQPYTRDFFDLVVES